MKRLLITVYRIYFYHRAVFWIVISAAVIAGFSLLEPRMMASPSRFLAVMLVTSIPAIAVVFQFGVALPNRHLAMIPHGRSIFLAATFLLLVTLSALFSWNMANLPGPSSPEFALTFMIVFCVCSVGVVVVCSVISRQLILPLALVVFVFPEPFQWALLQIRQPGSLYGYLFLLSFILFCWAWLIRNVRRSVEDLRRNPFMFAAESVSDLIGNMRIEGLASRLPLAYSRGDSAQLDATKTLFYGTATGRRGRLWFVLIRFIVMPIIGVIYVVVFVKPAHRGEVLLLLPLFLLIGLSVNAANGLASLRSLWLKVAGDRKQFWQLWSRLFHAELFATLFLLGLYGALVQIIFEVSDFSLMLYVVTSFLLLPSMCYSAAWFQLGGGFKSVLAVWAGAVYLSVITVLVIGIFAVKTYPSVVCLAAISCIVGLLAFFRVRKGFTNLDWMRVRRNLLPQ